MIRDKISMSPRTSRAYFFLLLIFFARKSFLYRILAVSRLFSDIYTHAVQTTINKRLARKILPGGGGLPQPSRALPVHGDSGERDHHPATDRNTKRAGGLEHAPQKLIGDPRADRVILRTGDNREVVDAAGSIDRRFHHNRVAVRCDDVSRSHNGIKIMRRRESPQGFIVGQH